MVDIDEDADADVDDAGSSGGGCRLATKDVGSASWQLGECRGLIFDVTLNPFLPSSHFTPSFYPLHHRFQVKLSWPVSLGYALHNSIGVMT